MPWLGAIAVRSPTAGAGSGRIVAGLFEQSDVLECRCWFCQDRASTSVGGAHLNRISACGLLLKLICSLISVVLGADASIAQTAPVYLDLRDAVGVERGSTALIGPVDTDTYFLTFDTFGSEEIGPSIASAAAAVPGLLLQRDQLDSVVVLGGPFETGQRELLALGLGYRIKASATGPTFFVNGDYSDIILGSAESRALGLTGTNWNLSLGVRHAWSLAPHARVTGELSFTAREWIGDSEALDARLIDEDLRILRGRLSYSGTTPFGMRSRVGITVHKGLPWLGSSPSNNPLSSLPGASSDFFTVSFSADAIVPISRDFVFVAGAIGQWSDASLPFSQRCGYGTNEFSRAFDRAFVNGDKCLGVRGEIAYNLPVQLPSWVSLRFAQLFAAADAGKLWNVGSAGIPPSEDAWGSIYAGLRFSTSSFISELTLSRIVDSVSGPIGQDTTRLWFRSALRF